MFETEQHDMLLEDLLKSFVSATYDSQRTQGVFEEFMINSEINSVSSGQTKWRKSSSEKVKKCWHCSDWNHSKWTTASYFQKKQKILDLFRSE